jgi:hypothetical protein
MQTVTDINRMPSLLGWMLSRWWSFDKTRVYPILANRHRGREACAALDNGMPLKHSRANDVAMPGRRILKPA